MPRTLAKSTPALEIILDRQDNIYQAGETITGRVMRTAPIVSSQAHLTIQLNGRTKSKLTVSRGQAGASIYRGRFGLFNPAANEQQLHDGPVHIAADGRQEWPFSLTIPSGPDPATVAKDNDQKFSYLPLARQEVENHSLPPVFYMSGWFLTTTYECFVEYFLEAKLHASSRGSGHQVDQAVLPFSVLPAETPGLISEFSLARRNFLCRINTYRLTRGSELGSGSGSATLSLQERTREFFGSSKVPQFAFSLQVEHPTTLQVGNPNPIPFRLLVLPDHDQTTELVQHAPPTVTLTSMTFEIEASTNMVCRGQLIAHTANQNRTFGFDLSSLINQRQEPIVVPSGEKSQPLDVGKLLQLCLTSIKPLGISRGKKKLYPSFTTYNIKHAHKLKWKLRLTAAGESTEVSEEVDLVLLPWPGNGLPCYEDYETKESAPAYELE